MNKKYSIIYYFDFNGTSECEPEELESGLTIEEAREKQSEYVEYFYDNTILEHYVDEDGYPLFSKSDIQSAYAIIEEDDVEEYIASFDL